MTNVREAAAWLGYTYLFVRMQKNPLAYGVGWEEVAADPRLEARRRSLIIDAARELERCKMARFDERSGHLYITELVLLSFLSLLCFCALHNPLAHLPSRVWSEQEVTWIAHHHQHSRHTTECKNAH